MLKQEFLKDVNAWYNKGIELRKQGKLKEAIECYDGALKLDPKNVKAWYNKGLALKNQGKLKEAIECYDGALKLDPKNVNAWNNKGVALKDQGKLKEAIECYDKATKLDPKYFYAWINKGFALKNQGKLKEAIECYDEALKLDPKNVYAWYNKGGALLNQGKLKEAIECYDEVLKLDPKHSYAGINKGLALEKQGKLKEAIECYDEVLKLDPKEVDTWNNKGFALQKQGKLKEAIECYNETIKLDPKYIFALNNKALALDVIGKFDEAEKYYLIANEMDQNKTEEWVNILLKDNKIKKGKLFLSNYNKNATTGSEVEVLLKDIKLGEYIDVFDKLGVKTINDILLLVEKDWESLHVIPYHQKKILQAITDKEENKYFQEQKNSNSVGVQESKQFLATIPEIELKNHFTDRKYLSEGGFGLVWSAIWRNSKVAVKQIKVRLETIGPESLLSIKKELDILSTMRHDRTLTLLYVCRDKENVYLVTKYYQRQSLYHLLKEEGPLNDHSYCVLLKDICEGLVYLHNYQPYPILHLDLKPKNILIDGYIEPRAVIADFGISSMKSESQRSVSTAGSFPYMAPELGSSKPTVKNDIFALAIIMWEMLYRKNPYPNIEQHEIPFVVSKGERPSWYQDSSNFSIFRKIKVLITQCWEHNPSNRPTAIEVLRKVEALM